MEHEIYKSSIIGPCSVIAVGMVCMLLYFLLKPKIGNTAPLNKKHDLKHQMEGEHENGNHIRIPKSKVHLVEALTMMGYEKEKIAQSIKQNNNVTDAIDAIDKLEAKDNNKVANKKSQPSLQQLDDEDDEMVTVWL